MSIYKQENINIINNNNTTNNSKTNKHIDKMPRKKKKIPVSKATAASKKKQKKNKKNNNNKLTDENNNQPKNFIEARTFLQDIANQPEEFYTKNDKMSKNLLTCVKLYFDYAKKHADESTSVIPGSELSELFIDGLDFEQIWEQINMQNIPIIKHYETALNDEETLNDITLIEEEDDDSDNDSDSGSDSESNNNMNANSDSNSSSSSNSDSDDDNDDDDEEVPYNDSNKNTRNNIRRKKKDDEEEDVDDDLKEKIKLNMEQDKFFNFEDFEKFADGQEDLGELDESVDIYATMYGEENVEDEDEEEEDDAVNKGNNNNNNNDDDDDMSSSDEEFEDGIDLEKQGNEALQQQNVKYKMKKKKKKVVNESTTIASSEGKDNVDDLTYADFFGPNKNNMNVDEMNQGIPTVSNKRNNSNDDKNNNVIEEQFQEKSSDSNNSDSDSSSSNSGSSSSSSSDDDSGDEDDESTNDNSGKLSRHAQYELNKKAEIAALEEEILQTKTWDMLGETSSRKRPENSLLEKDLDYQRTVKVAPTITEDVTQSIEDMIKQRIRDELWDDVERKMEDKDFKPNRELDEVSTEKSKLGLGDLYAQEYEENVLGNKSTKDIEQQKLYDEITGIWNDLSSKLDAMSNYHFTPKPVVDDIQIKSNVSSIQMEEVLPMGVSMQSRLAPEEVFKKKRGREGVLIGEDELNKDERARKRRAKKTARRKARKAQKADEKAIARINPGMGNKHAHKKMLETLASARNVTEGKSSNKVNYTKSSEFFNELTKDVSMISSSIRDKSNNKKNDKKGGGSGGSNLKL